MFSRLNLLLCALAFMVLTACGGSKGGGASTYDDDGYEGGGGGGKRAAAPKPNELKEAHDDAVSLTEENHKMAREIFELKNKLGLPTDE
ncbi:MAG: hypothetical protein LBB36_05960 [Fibromonadaceae bacterium]|nr:hypothetical protein [Fibromonadaceae bacterium]